jgi:hypothetical protein
LIALGYEGSYGRVAAFARAWKAERQREQQTSARGTFVPLAFEPGEALQFDSHGLLGVKSFLLTYSKIPPLVCFGIHGLSQIA